MYTIELILLKFKKKLSYERKHDTKERKIEQNCILINAITI